MTSTQFKLTTDPATQNVHLNLWLSFKTSLKMWWGSCSVNNSFLSSPRSSEFHLHGADSSKYYYHFVTIHFSWLELLFIFSKKINKIKFISFLFCVVYLQQMEISERLAFVREALVGDFHLSSLTRLWKRKVIRSKHR